jgi:hypothetical protein
MVWTLVRPVFGLGNIDLNSPSLGLPSRLRPLVSRTFLLPS